MSTNDELATFLAKDILSQNKIVLILGSGVSLNTSNSDIPNGVGSTSDYIKKFEKELKQLYGSNSDEYKKIITESNKSENKYSYLAKAIYNKENHSKSIQEIFKNEILPIIHVDYLTTKTRPHEINRALSDPKLCKGIVLNQGLESFGLLSQLLPGSTRIISSNFDPFIEIALTKNDVDYLQISYSYDLHQRKDIWTNRKEIFIEHYHGFWVEDTAHYELEGRENNIENFKEILSEADSIYVFGFGGWKDALSEALLDEISSKRSNTILRWAFHSDSYDVSKETSDLVQKVQNVNPNQENIKRYFPYYGIDTNVFFKFTLDKTRTLILERSFEEYRDKRFLGNANQIDEEFINSLPFKEGDFSERNKVDGCRLLERLWDIYSSKRNLIICSNFGLGKTTVLKAFCSYIAKNDLKYPILIDLAFVDTPENITVANRLNEIIYKEILKYSSLLNDISSNTVIKEAHLNLLSEYLQSNSTIILLFDSIDESVHKRDHLRQIREFLTNSNYTIVSSVRLEFHDFIDSLISDYNNNFRVIELVEWDENLALDQSDRLSISRNPNELRRALKWGYKRPIFLQLLSNLPIGTIDRVKDNLSSLYYESIDTYINDAINFVFPNCRKDEEILARKEYWDLISALAIAIYLEFQHYRNDSDYTPVPAITFSRENLRLLTGRYHFLNSDRLSNLLCSKNLGSFQLFKKGLRDSGLRAEISLQYTFFHRSFFEYLVAHGAASKIIEDAECSEAWDVYQTDEVSDYFVLEVQRLQKSLGMSISQNLGSAFIKEFYDIEVILKKMRLPYTKRILEKSMLKLDRSEKLVEPILEYSERLEEVIYYIGKFEDFWRSKRRNKFINFCLFIHLNARITYRSKKDNDERKPIIDPVYYRTTGITLSRLINNSYIFDYISYLIRDYTSPRKLYFNMQVVKDIKYYGFHQLYIKSKNSYEELLQENEEKRVKPLIILKLFSFFISICFRLDQERLVKSLTKELYFELKEKLSSIREELLKKGFSQFIDMLEGIDYIIRDLSFELLTSEDQILSRIYTAIKKRSGSTLDAYRLVNSFGDSLDYLEIDYYNENIIIDAKKDIYYKIRDKICETIKSSFDGKLSSIMIKYRDNSTEQRTLECLDGFKSELIRCDEIIPFRLAPEPHPKTGFFIDNRYIRQFIKDNSNRKTVLNLCSFTCTLGAIARLNGAKTVINVEKEIEYLDFAKEHIYKPNDLDTDSSEFVHSTLDDYLRMNADRLFDIIILDLPEYALAPCNFRNTASLYSNYNSKALSMLKRGGFLITSCCSHGFSRSRFKNVIEDCVSNGYNLREDLVLDDLKDHPIAGDHPFSDYLKIYVIEKTCS